MLFVFRLIKIGDKNVPEASGNSASGGIEKEILFERSELISFSKRKECSANFYSAVTFLCGFYPEPVEGFFGWQPKKVIVKFI